MADMDFKQIGLKIMERRQDQGLTQEFVANKLDVNSSHISNIEGGRAHPPLSAHVKIANILQCSVDYFNGKKLPHSHRGGGVLNDGLSYM